ncbi:hypothetical protein M9Y10_019856 [Tritrichomonas musculus]|uniref:Tetraspanin family protein n=1 Tax=Tritrichomonas musculus TaxID=1915356 RepID=A0ABR2HHH5_9EUKA
MTLEAILGSEKKMIVLVSLIMIGAGILADFIVTIVWWSRLHPWFSHAAKSGKTVYSALIAAWVFCLISIIVLALLAVFKFFVQSIYEKIGENRLISIIVIAVVSVLSVVIFICTIIPAGFALKNQNIYEDGEKYNFKCYEYVSEGSIGIYEYFISKYGYDYYETPEYNDFIRWSEKLDSHVMTKNDEWSNYLCAEVGAPALVFSLILLIGVILFFVVAIPVLKGSSDAGGNNSENENPQE